MKHIVVLGGVLSGIGKGIVSASVGRLLKNRGYKVTIQKLDPYLNVDPGTMNPLQHGEVFVTDDGIETDLDLGHYERFIDENLNKNSSITSGQIYLSVINKERDGEYLGKTVQVIPHITNEIKSKIYEVEKDNDIVITEIGGTIGDIESQPFIESVRQLYCEIGKDNCIFILVGLLPYLNTSKEIKTKPIQNCTKELLGMGIQPDIIVCRSEKNIDDGIREKISMFCNIDKKCVIPCLDAKNLYDVPINLEQYNIGDIICDKLNLSNSVISKWPKFNYNNTKTQTIGIVGKYVSLEDAYLSIVESIKHVSINSNIQYNIKWIDSEMLQENNYIEKLSQLNGIIVPGGFGNRGIDGMILAAKYCRENNVPYLGICLGMQIASIEFAKNVLCLEDANSTEFDENCKNPIIHIMEYQNTILRKGGTMRLGSYPCKLKKDSKIYNIYGEEIINERHRHRYEFNNKYINMFNDNGMIISGKSNNEELVEIIELNNHKWYIGVQFHPEYKSRPNKPLKLFISFCEACI